MTRQEQANNLLRELKGYKELWDSSEKFVSGYPSSDEAHAEVFIIGYNDIPLLIDLLEQYAVDNGQSG